MKEPCDYIISDIRLKKLGKKKNFFFFERHTH